MNQRILVDQIGRADPEELERLIAAPTAEEERTLREYLGEDQFEDLHAQALERSARVAEEVAVRRGNVVIIPGIMGSYLSAFAQGKRKDLVWPDPIHLARRALDLLRLSDDGLSGYLPEYDLKATGLMQVFYLKLTLSLWWKGWKVKRFWFDWRKDLKTAADELHRCISHFYGEDSPVHIVAHSMGGLVTRTFIKRHYDRWEKMWDRENDGLLGGRLVMLGTPNHGAFGAVQLLTGLGMVKTLADVNPHHEVSDLLKITSSFVGPYQMLPSPHISEEWRRLYDPETYARLPVSRIVPRRRLNAGLTHHELLSDVVVPERMLYIAGYGRKTQTGIKDYGMLHDLEAGYHTTLEGDGTVPHELGFLKTAGGEPVKTYFVGASHINLPRDGRVIGAMNDLLKTGKTSSLAESLPLIPEAAAEATPETPLVEQDLRTQHAQALAEDIRVKSAEPDAEISTTREERVLTEILMRSF